MRYYGIAGKEFPNDLYTHTDKLSFQPAQSRFTKKAVPVPVRLSCCKGHARMLLCFWRLIAWPKRCGWTSDIGAMVYTPDLELYQFKKDDDEIFSALWLSNALRFSPSLARGTRARFLFEHIKIHCRKERGSCLPVRPPSSTSSRNTDCARNASRPPYVRSPYEAARALFLQWAFQETLTGIAIPAHSC